MLFTGSVVMPTGERYLWQECAEMSDVMGLPWADLAAAVGALGHPVRLQLLQRVAHGIRTTGELADSDDLGTRGQLHHHLRQLVEAGWLDKSSRGHYELPPGRIIPLVVILAASDR